MSEIQHRVCLTSDVEPNTVKKFEIEGHSIAIYNVEGEFFASDDACTHGMSSLSEGALDGDIIECSLHFGAFNVRTGAPAGSPCSVPIKVYPVQVVEDSVVVMWTPKSEWKSIKFS